ncbi:MAG: hypothetical protein WDW36_006578 [Sanguina aurantia]
MSGVGGDSYYPSIAQAVEGGDELVVEAPGSEGSAHSSASDADVVMTVVRQHGVKDKQRLNSDGRSGGGTALEQPHPQRRMLPHGLRCDDGAPRLCDPTQAPPDVPALHRVEDLCTKVLAALHQLQLSLDTPPKTEQTAPTAPPTTTSTTTTTSQPTPHSQSPPHSQRQRQPLTLPQRQPQPGGSSSGGGAASVASRQGLHTPVRAPHESTFRVPLEMQPRSVELQRMRELWSSFAGVPTPSPPPVQQQQQPPEQQQQQPPEQVRAQQPQQHQQQQLQQQSPLSPLLRQWRSSPTAAQARRDSPQPPQAQPVPSERPERLEAAIPMFNVTGPRNTPQSAPPSSPIPAPDNALSCFSACRLELTSPRPLPSDSSPHRQSHHASPTSPVSPAFQGQGRPSGRIQGDINSSSSSSKPALAALDDASPRDRGGGRVGAVMEVNVSGTALYVDVALLQPLQASRLYRLLVSESAVTPRDPHGRIYLPYDSDCLAAIFAHLQELHLFVPAAAEHPLPTSHSAQPRAGVSTATPSDWQSRFGPRFPYLKRLMTHLGLADLILSVPLAHDHSFGHTNRLNTRVTQTTRFSPAVDFLEKQEIMLATLQQHSSSSGAASPREDDISSPECVSLRRRAYSASGTSPSQRLLPVAETGAPQSGRHRAWANHSFSRHERQQQRQLLLQQQQPREQKEQQHQQLEQQEGEQQPQQPQQERQVCVEEEQQGGQEQPLCLQQPNHTDAQGS